MQDVFGQNVQIARAQAQMTQETLAGVLAVSREYVSDIERGHVNVSMTRIVDLALALESPVEEFFVGVAGDIGEITRPQG